MILSACGGGKPIANFTYDLGGNQTLHAYRPEPAAMTRQGERMANKLYGIIESRSPKTPYFCVWRDTDPTRFRAKADAGPPHEIFLTCGFGTSAWSPPENLAEHAEQAMRRDEARVVVGWTRRDGGYAMNRIEVSVDNLAAGRNFRSVWFGDEIAGLAIRPQDITFPTSPVDSITFAITASLPRRYNEGEPTTAPTVTFTMAGTAPPIPDWVLY